MSTRAACGACTTARIRARDDPCETAVLTKLALLTPAFLLAGLVLVVVGFAWATPGVLDPSFGNRGTVTTVFGPGNDGASDVVLQSDGKIIAAGIGADKIALARYTASGALDPTFGTGGKVTTAVGSRSGAGAVAVQPDGKILVAGFTSNETNSEAQFALVRYTSTGAVDPTFGSGGTVTTPFAPGFSTARALVLEPNGKIVAAGFASGAFALARYGPDGSPDPSFGHRGTVTTTFGPGDSDARAQGLVRQPDGKLVAAGWSDNGSNYDFALARYRADGSLDPAFGAGGKVTTAIGPNHDLGYDVVLQPDGKLILAGMSESTSGTGFALVRYSVGRIARRRLRHGRKGSDRFQRGLAFALVRQPDGKLVAAGIERPRGHRRLRLRTHAVHRERLRRCRLRQARHRHDALRLGTRRRLRARAPTERTARRRRRALGTHARRRVRARSVSRRSGDVCRPEGHRRDSRAGEARHYDSALLRGHGRPSLLERSEQGARALAEAETGRQARRRHEDRSHSQRGQEEALALRRTHM